MNEWNAQPRLRDELLRSAAEVDIETDHRNRLRGLLSAESDHATEPRSALFRTDNGRRSRWMLVAAVLLIGLAAVAVAVQLEASGPSEPVTPIDPPMTEPLASALSRDQLCAVGPDDGIVEWPAGAPSDDGRSTAEVVVLGRLTVGPDGALDPPMIVQLGDATGWTGDRPPLQWIVSDELAAMWVFVPTVDQGSTTEDLAKDLNQISCAPLNYLIADGESIDQGESVLCEPTGARRYSGLIVIDPQRVTEPCASTLPTLVIHTQSNRSAVASDRWAESYGCGGTTTQERFEWGTVVRHSRCETTQLTVVLDDLSSSTLVAEVVTSLLDRLN